MAAILSYSEVDNYVRRAKASIDAAFMKVDQDLIKVENKERTINNINVIKERLKSWESSGKTNAGKDYPTKAGWNGWIEAGQILLKGGDEQVEMGIDAAKVLPRLAETIANIPKNLPKDLKNAGALVGSGVSGLASGFLGQAWWVLLLAGAGLVGFVVFKKKLLF